MNELLNNSPVPLYWIHRCCRLPFSARIDIDFDLRLMPLKWIENEFYLGAKAFVIEMIITMTVNLWSHLVIIIAQPPCERCKSKQRQKYNDSGSFRDFEEKHIHLNCSKYSKHSYNAFAIKQ